MKKDGFTLIELVVTTAIFGILAVVLTRMFIQMTQTNDKLTTLTKVKQEGDAVMSVMTGEIRNAKEITSCASNSITIVDRTMPVSGSITYALSSGAIASNSTALTNTGTTVSGFTIVCETGADGAFKVVRLGFTLSRTLPTSVSQGFSSTVGLRNY